MLLTWPRAHEALPSPNPLGKGGAGAASPPPTPLRFRGGGLTPRIASSPRTLPRATRESPPEISRIQPPGRGPPDPGGGGGSAFPGRAPPPHSEAHKAGGGGRGSSPGAPARDGVGAAARGPSLALASPCRRGGLPFRASYVNLLAQARTPVGFLRSEKGRGQSQISAAEASPLSSTAPCGHTLGDAHATPPGALPRRPERRRTARLAPCSEPGRISRISLERKARRCRGLWGHGACTPSSLLSLESREHSATNWLRETASGRSLAGLCGTLLPGDRRLENELCDVIDSADQWKKLPRRGVPPLSTWPPHARERASARGGGGENL